MAGLDVNTKSYSQHDPAGPLNDNDLLVIAQPWAQGANGYKTVNITLRLGFDTIMGDIATNGLSPNLTDPNGGLMGTGSTNNPLQANQEWMLRNYAVASMSNVSQVGRLERTTLPIGTAATTFSFPLDGRSLATFASPTSTGFDTLVPVTNGFDTSYNYGSGELITNNVVEYRTAGEQYIPRLPEGYDPGDYWVQNIFSCSKEYMVIKLRHVSGDRSLDELALVKTYGSLDGAYHSTFFITEKNLYVGNTAPGLNPDIIESKMKYTAFEQGGVVYLTRFDINVNDITIGDSVSRCTGILVYQLRAMDGSPDFRLTPILVKNIKSSFLGQKKTNTNVVVLTEGYAYKPASELDLTVVDKTQVEFTPFNMDGSSQAIDRFLDVLQFSDGRVVLRLNRTANFYVKRPNGSRQQFSLNYVYTFNVDMVNRTIDSIEVDPALYRPKLKLDIGIYSIVMNKQEATLWNGNTGRIETRCEDNLSITTPTTTYGDAVVTQRDSDTGDAIASAVIQTVDVESASISPDQISIPMSSMGIGDSQELMFIKGTEVGGYQIGGLNITSEDNPTYIHRDAKGNVIHGYGLDLERFTEQRYVDGVKLDSYSVVYNCKSGSIFEDLSGYYDTVSETRFGVITYQIEELLGLSNKSFTQNHVTLDFGEMNSDGTPDVDVSNIGVYVDHRSLAEWVRANIGYVNKGAIKIVPFFDGNYWRAFVHMSLVGGIGVGPYIVHLIAQCQRGDEDYILGAVEEKSVVIKQSPYDANFQVSYEQPELYNVSIFVEEVSGKVAILYGNFGEYSYGVSQPVNRIYTEGFDDKVEVRDLPFSSNFGLVTYYLDKVNGISFTSKDSWLRILHTSEQVPFGDITPMMARSEPFLLAAPAASGVGLIKVLEPIPFFLAGVNGFIPVQDVVIPSGNPSGVYYLYLGLRNKEPNLEVRANGTAERSDYTLIAVIRTSPSLSVTSEPFIRLGAYRLSANPKGAAIPVTPPRPDIEQFTYWD